MSEALDHTKKYYLIDGCKVTLSFSEHGDPLLFERLRNILIPHICENGTDGGTMEKNTREAS